MGRGGSVPCADPGGSRQIRSNLAGEARGEGERGGGGRYGDQSAAVAPDPTAASVRTPSVGAALTLPGATHPLPCGLVPGRPLADVQTGDGSP